MGRGGAVGRSARMSSVWKRKEVGEGVLAMALTRMWMEERAVAVL